MRPSRSDRRAAFLLALAVIALGLWLLYGLLVTSVESLQGVTPVIPDQMAAPISTGAVVVAAVLLAYGWLAARYARSHR